MTLLYVLLVAGSLPSVVLGAPLVNDFYTLFSKRATADVYRYYSGTGQTNWPAKSQWISSYDDMFNANLPVAKSSCSQWGVPNNSNDEINALRESVRTVAAESQVDARFIFAILMQESNGCVRAPTTNYGVRNPGLMQDHNGGATCNENGRTSNPCPSTTILQMVRDGVEGTSSGDGLVQLLNQAASQDSSAYYKAARMYNSGSISSSGELTVGATATACYASDVANRLTGWVFAKSGCSNGNNIGGSTVPLADLEPVASSPSPAASPLASPSPKPVASPIPSPVYTPVYSPLPIASSKASPSPSPSTLAIPSPSNTITAATRLPTAQKSRSFGLAPGVKSGCKKYYTVQSGDWCSAVAASNGLTFQQLRTLNEGIDEGCSNLWSGYDYCVEA